MHRGVGTIMIVALVVLAACAGSDDSSSTEAPSIDGDTTDTTPTTEPPTTAAPTTEATSTAPPTTAPPTTVVEVQAWQSIPGGEDCMCADGSDFEIWERPADPTKVVLYFEGGGACFSAESCSFTDGTYTSSLELGLSPDGRGGVFEADNPENPLADHSIVYVPYCTGDVHIGDATTEYSPELTIEHNGFANAMFGFETVLANYPDVEQLVVAGASAGSIPTPLFAGLAADELPDTEIITFGDSSGAYPDLPALNETIGALWGSTNVIPEWPENEGLTAAEWSLPGLYVQAGAHAPDVTFARFDYAYDEVQSFFGGLAGVPADELVSLIDQTEADVEATGVPLASYVAPGTEHTVIAGDEFYVMEVEGVRLVDFLAALVAGDVPDDVHCVDCQPPPAS